MPIPIINTYSRIVLADGPNGYWRLNDAGSTAVDLTGNGHNASIAAGVTKGVAGAISDGDFAMTLDGISGAIDAPFSAALNPPTTWSVEGWWNEGAGGQTANMPVLDCRPASSGALAAGFDLFLNVATGIGISVCSTNVAQTLVTTAVTPLTGWHYGIATYDGAQVRLYVDGTIRGGPTTCPYTPNPNKASAMGHLTGGANFLVGSIDEIAIYGYALTAAQVLNHYTAGTSIISTKYATRSLTIEYGTTVTQQE